MGLRQLIIDFETAVTREEAAAFADAHHETLVETISKDAIVDRTKQIWHAVESWMIDFAPAHGFCAYSLGALDKVTVDQDDTFTDATEVRLLTDEYDLATAIAIAVEEASLLIAEHGHPDDASTMVRAYYFALALNSLDYDLEHYLPGVPVHALGL